jgi:multiple sugar transport system permease protein
VFLLGFVSSWNNFFLPLVMINSPEAMPLTVGLAGWFQQANMGAVSEVRMPVVFAAALVGTLPVLIVFLLLQRFWQGGLASGAVKG